VGTYTVRKHMELTTGKINAAFYLFKCVCDFVSSLSLSRCLVVHIVRYM
jgi:hypothetical protein